MTNLNRSALFSAYNTASHTFGIERKRLNRALGLAQRTDLSEGYGTTATYCSCPDSVHRRVVCKHRLAIWLREASA